MKQLPNVLTTLRIILSLVFPFVQPLGTLFLVIYLVCGLTDVLDGWLARKYSSASRLGEELDSVADLLLVVVLFMILFPIVNPTGHILTWIIIIVLIRATSLLVVFVKYHTFQILHTYLNKITGVTIFLIPLSIKWIGGEDVIVIACLIATISAVEELCINIFTHELLANRQSIFHRSA